MLTVDNKTNTQFDPIGRPSRPYKSNSPPSNGPKQNSAGQHGSNYQSNKHYDPYQKQSAQGLQVNVNPFVPRSRQNNVNHTL